MSEEHEDTTCNGENCTAKNCIGHSAECHREHKHITNPEGIYDEDVSENLQSSEKLNE